MADADIPSLADAAALDGTELIHLVQGGNSRKGTITQMATYLAKTFKGFRANKSANQAISASTTTEVSFGTEDFDTESGFASNRFTVPSGLNGKYMNFFAGNVLDGTATVQQLSIQVSTDGGTTFNGIAVSTISNNSLTVSTGPILLATGHIFRVVLFITPALNSLDDDRTFFSGMVV